jgi:Low psii accumulation1 / Rep27
MPELPGQKRNLSVEQYARLKTEAKAPYRGLRKFIYVAFGASGLIGAAVFLAQLVAGREVAAALPNFALQLGVVALMVWLFRIDRERKKSQVASLQFKIQNSKFKIKDN